MEMSRRIGSIDDLTLIILNVLSRRMYCLLYSPISTVFAISLSVQPISGIPPLLHPVGPVLVPATHFSMHCASVESIYHLAFEPHP